MKQTFDIKPEVELNDLMFCHPNLLILFTFFIHYCESWGLDCKITSLMDTAPGRVSRTHLEGRAFDASVGGWTELHIHRLRHEMNTKYGSIGAISKSDGKPRAVVYHKALLGHDKHGIAIYGKEHLHFQVKRTKR